MVTSPYEWNILEWNKQTNKQANTISADQWAIVYCPMLGKVLYIHVWAKYSWTDDQKQSISLKSDLYIRYRIEDRGLTLVRLKNNWQSNPNANILCNYQKWTNAVFSFGYSFFKILSNLIFTRWQCVFLLSGIAGFANPLCAYCMSIRPCCCQRICAGRFAGGFGGIRSSIGLPISSGGAFGSSIGLPMSSSGGFGSSSGFPRGFGGGFSRPLYPGFPFSRSSGSFPFHRGRGAGFGSVGSGGLSGSFQGGGGGINSFGYDHDHDDW